VVRKALCVATGRSTVQVRRAADHVPDAEGRQEFPEPDTERRRRRPFEVEALEEEDAAAPLDALVLDPGDRVLEVGLVEECEFRR
jgi:hypothetical protein